jgi:hypothetical protein
METDTDGRGREEEGKGEGETDRRNAGFRLLLSALSSLSSVTNNKHRCEQ